jgi:aminoglycoside 2''-phosphotransferase
MDIDQLLGVIRDETGVVVDCYETILDGWDNTVIKVNDELIFRFTRREETRKQHIKELNLLPVLNQRLTLSIPRPIYSRTNGKPPYYMAYKYIPGEPLTRETALKIDQDYLVETITDFLCELQDTPISLFKQVPVYTSEEWSNQYRDLYDQVVSKINPMLETSTVEAISVAFNEALNIHGFFDYTPTLIHRDLTSDHILYSGNKITGVIDWGDSCFGDPAFDLTGFILDYDAKLVKKITDALETPEHFLNRTLFYAKAASFYGCLYGLETGDDKQIKRGITQIKKTFT